LTNYLFLSPSLIYRQTFKHIVKDELWTLLDIHAKPKEKKNGIILM